MKIGVRVVVEPVTILSFGRRRKFGDGILAQQ